MLRHQATGLNFTLENGESTGHINLDAGLSIALNDSHAINRIGLPKQRLINTGVILGLVPLVNMILGTVVVVVVIPKANDLSIAVGGIAAAVGIAGALGDIA